MWKAAHDYSVIGPGCEGWSNTNEFSWNQSSANEAGKVFYTINVSEPNSLYTIHAGDRILKSKSNKNGVLTFEVKSGKETFRITKYLNLSQLNKIQ